MDQANSQPGKFIDKVGFALLHKGIVKAETITRAMLVKEKEQGTRQRNVAQILVADFNIDHDLVFREVANVYSFRSINFQTDPLDEQRLGFIKEQLESLSAEQKQFLVDAKALPYKIERDPAERLIIATADPTHHAHPRIAYYLHARKYELVYVPLSQLQPYLDSYLQMDNMFLENIKGIAQEMQSDDFEEGNVDEAALDQEINKSMLVNLFEGSLVEATRTGASDIHIIPKSNGATEFHLRVDGKLKLWHLSTNGRPEAISAVIKDRSRNVDRFERERAQDGFIQRTIDNHVIRFRVSVLPIVGTEFGHKYESIVIRVLDDRKVITDLSKIGFQPYARDVFDKAIRKPQGMVILTGPTGSGKSTTLVAALHQVINPTVNVLTVEDPVEYVIYGARQIKLSSKLDFDAAIRAILRHDPDIVMVGEMRDKITADIAIKLANTGHLTFSTLHTNDAPSAVTRLFKMGIEPFLLAYAINLIVAQRLVRTLCPKCKRQAKVDVAEARALGFTDAEIAGTAFYEPVGCPNCTSGYKGRAAIHECLYFTPEIRHAIFESGDDIDEEHVRTIAIKQGMLTLRASGRERIKEGRSTIAEVAATTMAED